MAGLSEMTIKAYDRPMRVLAGLSTLVQSPEDSEDLETGIVVSEVGDPVTISHPAWADPFIAYNLRAPRELITPDFIFGSMELGDAFAAFMPRKFSAPAVGTPLIIDPIITPAQSKFIDMYNFIHADVIMIIHVPAPLGVGIYFEVYAPELDSTTVTRGIRFKPSGQPTVAVVLPWSNDLSLVNNARLGQSGGSIVIKTIEDNSSETVNTPINITVWCCVTNIQLTGWKDTSTTGVPLTKINFTPQTLPTAAVRVVEHGDSPDGDNEVTAEGGKLVSDLEYPKMGVPVAPTVEQPAEAVALPDNNMALAKKDTGHLATKWYPFATIEISDTVTSWQRVTIDPYVSPVLNKLGESMSLPWRRNVWTTGTLDVGYMRSLVIQVNIPRPPQISGVLEVKDSANSSSIHLVEFGGKVEIPLIPENWNGNVTSLPRYWLNPWLRTDESAVSFYYRVAAFNRTSDIANLNIRVLVRPGYANFEVPLKPKPNADTALVALARNYRKAIVAWEHGSLPEETASYVVNPHSFITPSTGHTGEQFNLHDSLGDDEDLELDEFPVLVFSGNIPVGEVTAIPIDLATIRDLDWDDGENAISQKFERFAHIVPKSAGGFGPIVGNYTIGLRLPTTVAGQIIHNCLPGDMVDQTMTRIFGLSSLLGIAGTAISSVGGPLVNGIINTTAPILSGAAHAIGGNVLGGVADAALGVAGSFFGNKSKSAQTEENVSKVPNAISGDIPISRFVEMLKYVKDNYTSNPIFPTLLVEPKNFFGEAMGALTQIPIEVFANMRNAKVERNIFDRTVVPIIDTPTVLIPNEHIPRIIEAFASSKLAAKEGTRQNIWLKKFVITLRNKNFEPITLAEIQAHSIPENFELAPEIEKLNRLVVQRYNEGGES